MKEIFRSVGKCFGIGVICGIGSWIGVELGSIISDKINEVKWKKKEKALYDKLGDEYSLDNN